MLLKFKFILVTFSTRLSIGTIVYHFTENANRFVGKSLFPRKAQSMKVIRKLSDVNKLANVTWQTYVQKVDNERICLTAKGTLAILVMTGRSLVFTLIFSLCVSWDNAFRFMRKLPRCLKHFLTIKISVDKFLLACSCLLLKGYVECCRKRLRV